MAKFQATQNLHLVLFLLFTCLSNGEMSIESIMMYPLACSQSPNNTCNSYLYHISRGLSLDQIGSLYSANISLIRPITHEPNTDYLVSVPCTCENVDGTTAYFHDTNYTVLSGDTSDNITSEVFNGQAWHVNESLVPEHVIPIHIPCGCLNGSGPEMVVSYTVQNYDTLSSIADLLSSDVDEIERVNQRLTANPGFIDIGWVLFVPMGKVRGPSREDKDKMAIILGISISIAFILVGGVIFFLRWRNRSRQHNIEDPKKSINKSMSAKSIAALENQYLHRESTKDVGQYESERPVVFTLEEVEGATANFDETRKIGEGGYGCVYFGMLGKQEVAIKKMKSNKSQEFFAELKVLCKVHHINVVELIGYASGDDHLYLVYEYVQNGSLSDHLHDPLLKGHQALSWNARAQIAFDTARGIEYIHDHTKACYVHRDIKTSNILLDEGLRAKVADFGLVKLVERSSEEDCFATRLVGTPGYLPPESVRDLQMTTKTDVFAFGVVLAELITGYRALIRDNKVPNKMKSLATVMTGVFREEAPETALETIIDGNLKESYPLEEVYMMAEISRWCLNEDPVNRPEMRELTVKLSQILMASIEWEASLGGNSQVFSGVFNGR